MNFNKAVVEFLILIVFSFFVFSCGSTKPLEIEDTVVVVDSSQSSSQPPFDSGGNQEETDNIDPETSWNPIHDVRLSNSDELWSVAQDMWEHYKRRYIYPLSYGYASRFKGETWLPYDLHNTHFGGTARGAFVSEGVGYGLLLSLLFDDQEIFDRILVDAERYLFTDSYDGTGFYRWSGYWDDTEGAVVSRQTNPASDADMDIAAALILALGRWGDQTLETELYIPLISEPEYSTFSYKSRAIQLINKIENDFIVERDGVRYITPGFNVLSQSSGFKEDYYPVNPSYFSLAWLRLYRQFQEREGLPSYDWDGLAEDLMTIMQRYPHFDKGIQPDWMDVNGREILKEADDGSYETDHRYSYDFYHDATRTPWRVALDVIWYNTPTSMQFCNNGAEFLWSNRDGVFFNSDLSYMTDSQGNVVYNSSGVAMWSTLFLASDTDQSQKMHWANELMSMVREGDLGKYVSGIDRYYENSLTLFALATLSGRFYNFYAER